MARGARASFLDYAPAVALLGIWALAGLGGAIEVARVSGDLRHVALGVVTAPSLILVLLAIRRAHRFAALADFC